MNLSDYDVSEIKRYSNLIDTLKRVQSKYGAGDEGYKRMQTNIDKLTYKIDEILDKVEAPTVASE